MKPIFKAIAGVALATASTGCSTFLDINNNPNSQTSVTPDTQLASALVTTAANYTGGVNAGSNYNSYASFVVGYWGKSGTVSGFSEERTYNYSTTYYQPLWNNTYDNLEDYQQIQTNGSSSGYPYHAAIARIMKVYNFLLLVDEYGDIPYSQALLGLGNVAPAYDKQADIYKDFIVQLKGAITDINTTAASASPRAVGTEDVVFQGNMARWKQFANSLRLRILLRQSSTNDATLNAYVATEMAALQTAAATDGYITTDVIVQPGFAANTGQQNPFYNRYGVAAGATRFNAEYSYVVPTKYIIRQYTSNSDARISQLYTVGTVDSVAAYSGTDLGEANPPQFDPTTRRVGSRFLNGGAFLKSATAPTVLMLLSEHLFSKAEAESRGLLTGTAQQDYLDGIQSSFITTYRGATTTPIAVSAATATTAGVSQYNAYLAANTTNGLVSWTATTTNVPDGRGSATPRTVSQTDKILYQKYLAENTLASTEAWDDYRRTAQPKFMVSLQSASPRADKLATRLLYPQTEVSTNNANIPTGITQFTKLFWDVID